MTTSGDGPLSTLCYIVLLHSQVVMEQHYGTAADVWSLGVTLYAIATGTLLFATNGEVMNAVRLGDAWTMPAPTPAFPPSIEHLMSRMLKVDQHSRATARELLRDDAFAVGESVVIKPAMAAPPTPAQAPAAAAKAAITAPQVAERVPAPILATMGPPPPTVGPAAVTAIIERAAVPATLPSPIFATMGPPPPSVGVSADRPAFDARLPPPPAPVRAVSGPALPTNYRLPPPPVVLGHGAAPMAPVVPDGNGGHAVDRRLPPPPAPMIGGGAGAMPATPPGKMLLSNSAGRPMKLAGGRYYCGVRGEGAWNGCRICYPTPAAARCGPSSGCECGPCHAYNVTVGAQVTEHTNWVGRAVRLAASLRYYCGVRGEGAWNSCPTCSDACGPVNGCECGPCHSLNAAAGLPAYVHIW